MFVQFSVNFLLNDWEIILYVSETQFTVINENWHNFSKISLS